EGLRRVRENNLQQLEAIKNENAENRKKIRKLKRLHDRLSEMIRTKQSRHDAIQNETTQIWENLGENSEKIRQIEQKLDKLYKNLMDLRNDNTKSKTTTRVLSGRIHNLNARKDRFASTLDEMKKSLKDL
ncbi:hypothetical protein GWO13_03320, partial [Candidatus Bathyarchaeota archaeon]|nr:hypothetical protein [Candidatus Bathyarchaeota archaeon]